MDSLEYDELFLFVNEGLYPELLRGLGRSLVNKRHHYKKKAECFYIKDGMLCRTVSGSVNGVNVVKQGATNAIMKEFHSSTIGGHSGFNKTNSAIKVRYWWPKMTEDIRNYVKLCELCQKSDPMKPAKKPDLKSIHVTRPFELVGCDLMGPFQETESGFKYVFTATDYYTKWVEAFPIQTKSAKDVSACMKKLLYRHGAMNAILTDQGREFINEVNRALCEEWNISHRVTAAYHPQTNGLDEKTNQTIKRALSKCVNESQTDWDVRLDQVLFSLRTKPQSSTKYSPFFLLYGREAQYPSQLSANFGIDENISTSPPEGMIEEGLRHRRQNEETTKERVQENVNKSKEKQQRDFRKANEKKSRSYVDFAIKDKVLKFNCARAGRKSKADLNSNYTGPYIITEIIGHRVKLENLDGKVLKSLVSMNNIKIFKELGQVNKTTNIQDNNSETTTQDNNRENNSETTTQDKNSETSTQDNNSENNSETTTQDNNSETTTQDNNSENNSETTTQVNNFENNSETPTPDNSETTTQENNSDSTLQRFLNGLDEEKTIQKVYQECKHMNSRPGTLSSFTRNLPTDPMLSFINKELKTGEEGLDDTRDAILQCICVEEKGDFSGALLLTSAVIAKSFKEDVSPLDVLETIRREPSFLKHCKPQKELKRGERITVAGEGLEREDINSLKGNNWLNDKVINGYTKLISREGTDTTNISGTIRRMFMIPSYTATLWDSGVYENYMFKKVDFTLYDVIVIPWNKNGNHWVVLVAFVKESTVTVYDSLNGDNSHLIDKFCTFMKKRTKIVKDGLHHWDSVSPALNQQSDGCSCGVFVLMTLECIMNGKAPWILHQAHVPFFRKYVKERLLNSGMRNSYLCDSLYCSDPRGKVNWVSCDVCSRWLHKACTTKAVTNRNYQCAICDAQYS